MHAPKIDNSTQQDSNASSQQKGSSSALSLPAVHVMQLALDAGKLNVAGEDHGESDKKRDGEKAFSSAEVGGKYWEENEFPATAKVDAPKADSPKLLENFTVAAMKEIITAINAADTPEKKKTYFKRLYEQVEYLEELYENNEDDVEIGEADQWDELSAICVKVKNEAVKAKVEQAGLDAKTELERVVTGPIGTIAEASMARAKAMNAAASNQTATPGVWKIGEEHITEIKKIWDTNDATKDSYKLHTKDQFDTEYDAWQPPPP
ncbi:MAG: hypothetical protein V4539_13495 [Bacteroidota bacterium]